MKYTLLAVCLLPAFVMAGELSIDMYSYPESKSGEGTFIGKIHIQDSAFGGILINPQLNTLPTGIHGFHIHSMPTCAPSEHDGHIIVAGAAGGHFDPAQTNIHAGPYGSGHLGDLPVLVVNNEQLATLPTLAPRLKTSDLHGHSLMIHIGGDNYSDSPAPNGGGGIRLACGVIP